MIKGYAVFHVEDIYEDETTFAVIHATDVVRSYDGMSNVSEASGTEQYMNCYDTLREAIVGSQYWAPKLEFGSDFTDAERNEAAAIINELVHSKDYCEQFSGHTLDEFTNRDYTIDDMKSFDVTVNKEIDPEIPEPVEDNSADVGDEDKDYGDE